jgi:tRNA(adenine34) deaminase
VTETGMMDKAARHAMELAYAQALRAAAIDEVPVGVAILGPDGGVLAEAHNESEMRRDPTAHAERIALTEACRRVGHTRLPEGSLVAVTLEPCAMCAGALVLARAGYLVFGALDPKAGACGSLRNVVTDPRLNHRVQILDRLMEEPCGQVLTDFFRIRRARG